MITKETLHQLISGRLAPVAEALDEKAANVLADIINEESETLLEMTPGHKEMMKQHLDALDIVDLTPEDKDGKGKVRKTNSGVIKNINPSDDRDDYNQLDDFQKGSKRKKKSPNFIGKKYTTNERALRSE